ncbi:helix-turn-helix transcriptional regulator [Aquihabitans sp. G128]|uniref:winged helix-turn-helix transcriptional regulator n=1 Tax=Aquihabitans sp. G128 TaxID=2849779 RepID=UPI001C24C1BA|nr:helix-turn-helix domain-containing protein [Aquihabitans sp. G128]QXC61116.1 helix-turn-helix transcriptional regulator [Aquihabitans sp. G128]
MAARTPAPDRLHSLFADGVLPEDCPSRTLLSHVTSKWGVLVLVGLADGSLRWSELRDTVQGVSEKMLAQTLRTLEADGLVHRDAQPSIPPRVDYSLTPVGQELVALLFPLVAWTVANAEALVPAVGR